MGDHQVFGRSISKAWVGALTAVIASAVAMLPASAAAVETPVVPHVASPNIVTPHAEPVPAPSSAAPQEPSAKKVAPHADPAPSSVATAPSSPKRPERTGASSTPAPGRNLGMYTDLNSGATAVAPPSSTVGLPQPGSPGCSIVCTERWANEARGNYVEQWIESQAISGNLADLIFEGNWGELLHAWNAAAAAQNYKAVAEKLEKEVSDAVDKVNGGAAIHDGPDGADGSAGPADGQGDLDASASTPSDDPAEALGFLDDFLFPKSTWQTMQQAMDSTHGSNTGAF